MGNILLAYDLTYKSKSFLTMDENINKYGYINTWILRIYKKILVKYRWNQNYSKLMKMLEKTPKDRKISKNTHVKVIL